MLHVAYLQIVSQLSSLEPWHVRLRTADIKPEEGPTAAHAACIISSSLRPVKENQDCTIWGLHIYGVHLNCMLFHYVFLVVYHVKIQLLSWSNKTSINKHRAWKKQVNPLFIISLWKRHGPSFEQNWNPFTQECLLSSLLVAFNW